MPTTSRSFRLPPQTWADLAEIARARDLYCRPADPTSGLNRTAAIVLVAAEEKARIAPQKKEKRR